VLIVALHPPALAASLPMLGAGLLAVIVASLPGMLHGSPADAGPVPRRGAFSGGHRPSGATTSIVIQDSSWRRRVCVSG
ncbi:MAG: hypothetical protein LXA50_22805, partial [Betaproteobacteria bacterium]|jgi:hypothetical protein|nr:hypothetical protein [Betaproteobacteria bacterium]